MHGIGPQLRAAREAREISLDQAEEETKIRKRYLEALESDTPGVIPGDVYVRGFIRSYGNYLGLDGTQLVEEYKERLGGAPAPAPTSESAVIGKMAPGSARDPVPAKAATGAAVAQTVQAGMTGSAANRSAPVVQRKQRHRPGSAALPLLVGCVVVAVAIIGYLMIRGLGKSSAKPPAELPTQQGAQTGPSGTGAGSNPTPPTTATGTPASTDTPATKITMNQPKGQVVLFDVPGSAPIAVALQFEPRAQVWMEVSVDGKVIGQQTTTDPAKTKWTGKTISIRLGNAETLKAIMVNGQSFERPLKGGPFTLTFAPPKS